MYGRIRYLAGLVVDTDIQKTLETGSKSRRFWKPLSNRFWKPFSKLNIFGTCCTVVLGSRFPNWECFVDRRAVFYRRWLQKLLYFRNRLPLKRARRFPKDYEIGTGFHIKVDGAFQMNPKVETDVHIYYNASFQFIQRFRTGVHIEQEDIFHLHRPQRGKGSLEWFMVVFWMLWCVKTVLWVSVLRLYCWKVFEDEVIGVQVMQSWSFPN